MKRVEDIIDSKGRLRSEARAKRKKSREKRREKMLAEPRKKINPVSKRQRGKLAWRAKRKRDLMVTQPTYCNSEGMGTYYWCPLGEHYMSYFDVELCHKKAVGMRGDGDEDENTFLGCRNGNRAQGSVSLEVYMQKPLEERKRLCGVIA